MAKIISFPIDRTSNTPVKILTVYNEDMETILSCVYFGDDWQEDVSKIKAEFGDECLYILTNGINL